MEMVFLDLWSVPAGPLRHSPVIPKTYKEVQAEKQAAKKLEEQRKKEEQLRKEHNVREARLQLEELQKQEQLRQQQLQQEQLRQQQLQEQLRQQQLQQEQLRQQQLQQEQLRQQQQQLQLQQNMQVQQLQVQPLQQARPVLDARGKIQIENSRSLNPRDETDTNVYLVSNGNCWLETRYTALLRSQPKNPTGIFVSRRKWTE